MKNEKGRWITTKKGRHVFIPEGKDIGEVLKEKFGEYDEEDTFDNEEISLEPYEIVYQFQKRSSTITIEQKDYLVKLIDKMPNDCKRILSKLEDKRFSFIVTDPGGTDENGERERSLYNRSLHKCCVEKIFLQEFDENESYYTNGEVECHEIGHMVDNLLCDDKWGYTSSTYKSKVNGMTLHETIYKERRKFNEKIIHDIAFKTATEFEEKELESLGREKIEKWETINRMASKELDVDLDQYDTFDSYYEELNKRRNEKFKELYPDDDFSAFNRQMRKLKNTGKMKFIHEYTALSDIASSKWFETGAYGSKNHGFGLGHTEYYYLMRKDHGLGTETFANLFSAKCTNHDEVIKTTEKYFPQSVAIFREIMEEMAK